MKLRKILAMTAAAALAVSAMATSAFAASIEKGQAILAFGDADWKTGAWAKPGNTDDTLDNSYFTIADVTADGTYTVAVDLSAGYTNVTWLDEETGDPIVFTTANGIGAMGINLNLDPEDEAYANVVCTVKSVKFDGTDYPVTGVSFTNTEDGLKRTNVINEWATFDSAKADHVSTDPANATGKVIDTTGLTEWTKCEVTFEVTGMPAADAAAPAEDAGTEATGDKANSDTGVEGIAVVAGLAIVAAGAVVVAKKRK